MDESAGIYARESDFLGRWVQFGVAGERVLSVAFPTSPAADAEPDHELLGRVFEYLEGVEDDFADVRVALTMATDRRTVLETAREIPYGEQLSVERLVRRTPGLDADTEDDRELVRAALDENPAPLFVPDHRVRDGPSAAPPEIEQKLRSLEGL
jgi:methylated-DNA-[protein]-cysteine S-methyltransferase